MKVFVRIAYGQCSSNQSGEMDPDSGSLEPLSLSLSIYIYIYICAYIYIYIYIYIILSLSPSLSLYIYIYIYIYVYAHIHIHIHRLCYVYIYIYICVYIYIYIVVCHITYQYKVILSVVLRVYETDCTVSFHNFKSQNFKLRVSNPKSKYVAYLSVLSRISNCQGLGRKNKHVFLKTDRTAREPWRCPRRGRASWPRCRCTEFY